MKCGPDGCPIVTYDMLRPAEKIVQRKTKASELYRRGFTEAQIAKQLGVSQATISGDLKGLSTIDKPPRPQGGRPKSKRGKSTPQLNKARTIVRNKLEADEPINSHKLEKEHGISHVTFDMAIYAEIAHRQALDDPPIDAKTLSLTVQEKLNAAIRQHKRKLDLAFEQKVNELVIKRIAAADDATRKQNKELREENLRLRTMLNQRAIFSELQFKQLLMCVHPENSASVSVRNELLPFINKNRERLVKNGG